MWLGRQFKDAMTPENNTSSTMGSSRLESHRSLHSASCLTSHTWPQTPPKTTARTSGSNMVENGSQEKLGPGVIPKESSDQLKQGFHSNKFPASQITTATADDTWCMTTPFCALRIHTCMSSCDANCLYPFLLNVAEPLFFSIEGGGFYCARNGTGTISEVIRIMHSYLSLLLFNLLAFDHNCFSSF
jgi:hypothetical protein